MTATAPKASADPAVTGATGGSSAQLWQVPTFLLGVSLLLGVWMTGHCGHVPSCWASREVAAARQVLSRPDGNVDSVVAQLTRILEQPEPGTVPLGEVHFLLGTGKLRQADYQSALQHLEQARRIGVPKGDEGLLQYRLAQAAFHTGGNPDQLAGQLAAGIEQVEEWEKAEAYRLLTTAYLRQSRPDYQKALETNEKLRKDVARVPTEILDAARVTTAELLLKLQRPPGEARKALEHLSALAPPALLAKARLLRAQSCFADGHWQDAVNQWKVILLDLPQDSPERSDILYRMGLCYRKLEQNRAAQDTWELCCRSSSGQEEKAAALALAELHLEEKQFELANKRLASAVRDVSPLGEWHNALIDLARVRAIFERALQIFREANRFDLADELINHFERVTDTARPALIRAEVLSEWGRARRKSAQQLKEPEAQTREEELTHDLLCRAGAAYEKAAAAAGSATDQANLLWLALACYREAPQTRQVIALFPRFLEVNDRSERSGEGWYLLGEAFRQEKKQGEAVTAYQKCIEHTTPFAFRARYQLAMFAQESGNLDEAEKILEENLKFLRVDASPDAEACEKSKFALGHLQFLKRKYREVLRLEEALVQYPNNPAVPRARYQVAESYWQLAIQMNQQCLENSYKAPATVTHFREEHRFFLGRAAQGFLDLAYDLEKAPPDPYLTEEERRQVPFRAADCIFNLGKYTDALRLYEYLALLHRGKEDGLLALGNTIRCLAALHQEDQLKKRLEEIQQAMAGMEPQKREAWEKWLEKARRPTMKLPNPETR